MFGNYNNSDIVFMFDHVCYSTFSPSCSSSCSSIISYHYYSCRNFSWCSTTVWSDCVSSFWNLRRHILYRYFSFILLSNKNFRLIFRNTFLHIYIYIHIFNTFNNFEVQTFLISHNNFPFCRSNLNLKLLVFDLNGLKYSIYVSVVNIQRFKSDKNYYCFHKI